MKIKSRKKKIVTADDHERFRQFVSLTIEESGRFQVIGQASDGLEAVQKAEEFKPDLVLLDIGMPKLSGIQAAHIIRKRVPTSRILFLSSESDAEVVLHALESGALGYVHKPQAARDLIPAIDAVLRGQYFVSSSLSIPELRISAVASAGPAAPSADRAPISSWITPIRLRHVGISALVVALLCLWYAVHLGPLQEPSRQMAISLPSAPTLETARESPPVTLPSKSSTRAGKRKTSAGTLNAESSERTRRGSTPVPGLVPTATTPLAMNGSAEPPPLPPPVANATGLDSFSMILAPSSPPPDPPLVQSKLDALDFVPGPTLQAHSRWVTSVAFSSDGRRLASGSWDQTVKFWDIPAAQEVNVPSSKIKREVQAMAFSSDGDWLAIENSSNDVALWDATTGRSIRTLPSDKAPSAPGSAWVYSIAFSPDGRWLAAGIDDKTVRIWDVKTGEKVRDLTARRRTVMYTAFSADGHWLASGDGDKDIEIWDVLTGQVAQRLQGHKGAVFAVVFSPDSRWAASASADKTVKIWDLANGQEVRTLVGHTDVVTSLIFADSSWLASGSWDKTIKVWNVGTGDVVQTLKTKGHPVYAIAFDASKRWLASGNEDGTINLWRFNNIGDRMVAR